MTNNVKCSILIIETLEIMLIKTKEYIMTVLELIDERAQEIKENKENKEELNALMKAKVLLLLASSHSDES